MKFKKSLFILWVLLCFVACSKDNSSDEPDIQPEVENYFRGEINGEPWEAELGANGTYLEQAQGWGVTSVDSKYFIQLIFNGPYEDTTYVWNENTDYYGSISFIHHNNDPSIYSTQEVSGQAVVRFDSLTTTFARGSFDMHGVNEVGDTINISNGEFQVSMETTPGVHLDSSFVSLRFESNELPNEYQYFTTSTSSGPLISLMTRDNSRFEILTITIPTTIADSVTYPLEPSSLAEITWRENDFIPQIFSTGEGFGSGSLTVDSVIDNRIMGTFFFTGDDGNGNVIHAEDGIFDIYFD